MPATPGKMILSCPIRARDRVARGEPFLPRGVIGGSDDVDRVRPGRGHRDPPRWPGRSGRSMERLLLLRRRERSLRQPPGFGARRV
jgi:hypothetical protein